VCVCVCVCVVRGACACARACACAHARAKYICAGHCYDSLTGNPPRGLQFVLGTNSTPAIVDTIVMANLVCSS